MRGKPGEHRNARSEPQGMLPQGLRDRCHHVRFAILGTGAARTLQRLSVQLLSSPHSVIGITPFQRWRMPARAASFTSSGELLRPKGTIDFIPLPIHRLDLTMHYGRRIDKSIEGGGAVRSYCPRESSRKVCADPPAGSLFILSGATEALRGQIGRRPPAAR
jgi:hypothetical protein